MNNQVIPAQAVDAAVHIPGAPASECPCEGCRDCVATFAPDWKERSNE